MKKVLFAELFLVICFFCSGCFNSGKSNSDSIAKSNPSLSPPVLSLADVTTTTINILWTDVEAATGYNVYASTNDSETYTRVTETPVTELNTAITGLFPSETVWFKVTSVNDDGESDFSNIVSGTTTGYTGFVLGKYVEYFNKNVCVTTEPVVTGYTFVSKDDLPPMVFYEDPIQTGVLPPDVVYVDHDNFKSSVDIDSKKTIQFEFGINNDSLDIKLIPHSGEVFEPIYIPNTNKMKLLAEGVSKVAAFLFGQFLAFDKYTGENPTANTKHKFDNHSGCDSMEPLSCTNFGSFCDSHDACITEYCTGENDTGNVLFDLLKKNSEGTTASGFCIGCHEIVIYNFLDLLWKYKTDPVNAIFSGGQSNCCSGFLNLDWSKCGKKQLCMVDGKVISEANVCSSLGKKIGDHVSGSATGDPHFTTLDGVIYHNQYIGEFVFSREIGNTGFELQTRQGRINGFSPCVTLNTAVAMRIDINIVEYRAATNEIIVDGNIISVSEGENYYLNGGGSVLRYNGIICSDSGVKGVVTVQDSGDYLNVIVSVSKTLMNTMEGLMGNFDEDPSNDHLLRDGTLTSDTSACVDDWRIKDGESLFTYPSGKSTKDYTGIQTCGVAPSSTDIDKATQIYENIYGTGTSVCDQNMIKSLAIDLAAGMSENDVIVWINSIKGYTIPAGTVWYQDADGDGLGNSTVSVISCSKPDGYVDNSSDCNDQDSNNSGCNDTSNAILNPTNGHYYKLIKQNMTWHDAKLYCESLGGYLATATSQAENDFIYNNLVLKIGIFCWIGATDEVSEGTWLWVTV